MIILLYTFFVFCFDWCKEQTIYLILFNKLSELLPAFICKTAIGNLWSIWLYVNIFSLEWSGFKIPVPLNFVENILLSKASIVFLYYPPPSPIPPKKLRKVFKNTFFGSSFFFQDFLVFHFSQNSWFRPLNLCDVHEPLQL